MIHNEEKEKNLEIGVLALSQNERLGEKKHWVTLWFLEKNERIHLRLYSRFTGIICTKDFH